MKEKISIHWVSWNDICLPVDKGGLGLRRLEDFNLALLLKWKWRILEATNSFWYSMLKERYGDVKLRVAIEGGKLLSRIFLMSIVISMNLTKTLYFT